MGIAEPARKLVSCPLCGWHGDSDELRDGCRHCPLAAGCRLSRCPRCGYESAPRSQLATWIGRLWAAGSRKGHDGPIN